MGETSITLYAEDFTPQIWEEEYCDPLGIPANSKVIEIIVKDVKVKV